MSLKKRILIIIIFSVALSPFECAVAQERTPTNKSINKVEHKHEFELKTGREIFLLALGAGLNSYNIYLQNQVIPLTPMEIAQLDPPTGKSL